MAFIPCKIGGGGSGEAILDNLSNVTTGSTATTINVTTGNLSDYKFLVFTAEITSSPLITNQTYTVLAVVTLDYFKSNNLSATYLSGNSGSGTYNAITISYIDNNTVRFTRSNTLSRKFNVFGIK